MSRNRITQLIRARKPKLFYGYIVVLAAFLILVVTGGVWVIFGVLFEPLITEFGWARATLSGAYSLCLLLMTLFGIGGGRLTDKFGPRPVVIICGLLLGLGFFLMSLVNTTWQLYLVYSVILGAGMSGLWVPMITTVSRWFAKKRALMTGIVLSGMGVGTIIMPTLATWLMFNHGWRTSCTIVGIVAFLLLALIAPFLRRAPDQRGEVPYGTGKVEVNGLSLTTKEFSLRQAIHTRQFWILCAVYGCLWFSVATIWAHIVIHAIDMEISAISAASLLATIGGVGIPGRVLMGSVADRIGYKPILLIGFGLLSVSLLWLLITNELWALYLFAIVFGWGLSSSATLESPLTAKLFGLNSLGIILGSIEFVSTVLGVTGPILAGYIFDTMGNYQIAFIILAAVSLIGLVLTVLLGPISEGGNK